MGLTTVAGPASEPITLIEAKDHCRVTGFDEDGLIAGLILAAREHIEGQTHRRLITQTLDYTIDYSWPCRIVFPVAPLASVTSISYVDTAGATQTLSGSLYTAALDRDHAYIEPAYGASWPDVQYRPAAITVRFVAGSAAASVPNPLTQAIRMLVAYWYDNREAAGAGLSEIPHAVEALISPYRFVRL